MKNTPLSIETGTEVEDTSKDRIKKIYNIKFFNNKNCNKKIIDSNNSNNINNDSSHVSNVRTVNNIEGVTNNSVDSSTVANITVRGNDEIYEESSTRIKLEEVDVFYNNNRSSIVSHFKKVPMKSEKGIVEGKKERNRRKNNYKDIIPFDFNRVKLTGGTDDYINASYIKSYHSNDYQFIATQGVKKEEDVGEFWRMVVQKQVVVIIMLTPLLEDQNKVKCFQYWPDSGTKEYGSVRVELKEVMKWPTFEIRNMLVSQTESGVSLLVSHMFYLAWPDHGVPCNVASVLNFHHKGKQRVQQKVYLKKDNAYESEQQAVNVVIQCSDGVGRTGTMIGIDFLIEEGRQSGFIDPLSRLKELRRQRNKMIQNEDQFLFCYKVLAVYGKIGNTTIYTTKNDALKTFLGGNQDKLTTALKHQIDLIQENAQPKHNEKGNVSRKSFESYPGFSRPQAFRLGSIEDVSDSLFLELLLDCCFVLVLHQHTMNKLSKFLPAQHQSIDLRNFKVTRMNGVGSLRVELKIEKMDSAKRNKSNAYENSAVYPKSLIIECASVSNDVTECYKHLRKQLQDTNEQPVLILYSIKERQDCLWSLVKLHLLEMADKHAEVDVYQSVYNIHNCPSTTHNFSLDVASYKHMHHFALELLQKDHRIYENETDYDDITNTYANDGYQRVDSSNNAYLKHDNNQSTSENEHLYEDLNVNDNKGKCTPSEGEKSAIIRQSQSKCITRNPRNISIHPPTR